MAVNKPEIKKKKENKIRTASARSTVAPKEKITETLSDDKNAVASVSSPNIINKKIKPDSSIVLNESKKRNVAKRY